MLFLKVKQRLERLRKRHQRLGVASFLTDNDQYRHVRKLWELDRVRPVRGDLTQDKALTDVAAFARAAKLPVRSIYLSNAEDYFSYEPYALGLARGDDGFRLIVDKL